jgi:hypothetical protein
LFIMQADLHRQPHLFFVVLPLRLNHLF